MLYLPLWPARVVCVLVLLLVSCVIPAQVKVGFSGGGTAAGFDNLKPVTTTNPANDYEKDLKTGFNGGIKLNIPFSKAASSVFNLTPEVFFNQNGNQDQYYTSFASFRDSLLSNKVALDYIGIYLPLKIKFENSTSHTGIFITGAMYADYALNGKAVTNSGEKKEINFAQQKDRYDMGWRASLGLIFSENTGLEFGYNKGISEIKFAAAQQANNANYLVNNHGWTVSFVALF